MNESSTSALAATFKAARDSVRAAASAAAHVAALYLIEANGGQGGIHKAWKGEGADGWCRMAAPGLTVTLLADSLGDRAHMDYPNLTPAEYDRIRAWFDERDDCPHDEECDCHEEPWPTPARLADGEDLDISFLDGNERGYAHRSASGVRLTLLDEPVELVAALLRTLRTD